MSLASLLARRLPLFDYEGYIGKESIYAVSYTHLIDDVGLAIDKKRNGNPRGAFSTQSLTAPWE